MAFPSKNELPLVADPIIFEIDDKKVKSFQTAFRQPECTSLPPTWASVGLQGIFALLNQLNVDWKKLLHATQKFEYGIKPSVPFSAKSETRLTDIKYRGQIYWLSFEGIITENYSNEKLVQSKTLILVRE